MGSLRETWSNIQGGLFFLSDLCLFHSALKTEQPKTLHLLCSIFMYGSHALRMVWIFAVRFLDAFRNLIQNLFDP
jgi:hypothetical protein